MPAVWVVRIVGLESLPGNKNRSRLGNNNLGPRSRWRLFVREREKVRDSIYKGMRGSIKVVLEINFPAYQRIFEEQTLLEKVPESKRIPST